MQKRRIEWLMVYCGAFVRKSHALAEQGSSMLASGFVLGISMSL